MLRKTAKKSGFSEEDFSERTKSELKKTISKRKKSGFQRKERDLSQVEDEQNKSNFLMIKETVQENDILSAENTGIMT